MAKKKIENKPTYTIEQIISDSSYEDTKSFIESLIIADFADDSHEQKTKNMNNPFIDTVSRNQTEISSLVQFKINAIANDNNLNN